MSKDQRVLMMGAEATFVPARVGPYRRSGITVAPIPKGWEALRIANPRLRPTRSVPVHRVSTGLPVKEPEVALGTFLKGPQSGRHKKA